MTVSEVLGSWLPKEQHWSSLRPEDACHLVCVCFPAISLCGSYDPDYTIVDLDDEEDCPDCLTALESLNWVCPRCGEKFGD